MSVREAIAHLHAIQGEIVGADLVEYNPVQDVAGVTATWRRRFEGDFGEDDRDLKEVESQDRLRRTQRQRKSIFWVESPVMKFTGLLAVCAALSVAVGCGGGGMGPGGGGSSLTLSLASGSAQIFQGSRPEYGHGECERDARRIDGQCDADRIGTAAGRERYGAISRAQETAAASRLNAGTRQPGRLPITITASDGTNSGTGNAEFDGWRHGGDCAGRRMGRSAWRCRHRFSRPSGTISSSR